MYAHCYPRERIHISFIQRLSRCHRHSSQQAPVESVTSLLSTTLPLMLRVVTFLQLRTTDFVATQKGWDYIGFKTVIVVATMLDSVFSSDHRLAHIWRDRGRHKKNLQSRVHRPRGHAQGSSNAQEEPVMSWMDCILAPSDCRRCGGRS